jgi:hypothetical protein
VCCDKDGDAKLIDLPEQLHDLPADERIKVSGRLIGNEQLRVANDGARDRSALLLAARERVRVSLGERSETNNPKGALNSGVNLFAWRAGDLQRKCGVLANGASLQESEVLEDHANTSTQVGDLARLKGVYRVSGNVHFTRERDHVAYKEADQRRLPRARGPNKEGELTRVNGEADACECCVSAWVLNADISQRNDRLNSQKVCRTISVHGL